MISLKKIEPLSSDKDNLLLKFNNRNSDAFGIIYSLFYKELFYFTSKLVKDTTLDANDVLQDIFLKLWEKKERTFDEIIGIKAYLYVSIKNYFRNNIDHQKTIDKYIKNTLYDDDYFIIQIAEIETFSILKDVTTILPEECAKVFNLYCEGYSTKEIALKLNKTESTIYTQRQKSIDIVRKRLSRMKFYSFLFSIINI